MKRIIALIIVAILSTSGVALATSDISDAIYYGTVRATNTGTLATNVSANVSINTASLISAGVINSTATNIAVRNAAGSDAPFMVGTNSTNPWCFWFDSVPANGNADVTLYTNADNTTVYYFPGTNGMATSDDDTIELSDNFTYEVSGFIDTTAGASKYIRIKPGAFMVYVDSTVSGNITADILDDDWILPTGNTANGWTNPTNAYDDNTGTYASYVIADDSWSNYLELSIASTSIYGMRFYCNSTDAAEIDYIDVDLYYNGAYQDLYQGSFSVDTWTTKAIGTDQYEDVTAMRVRFHNKVGGGNVTAYLKEAQFGGSVTQVSASATSIDSDDYILEVSTNTTHLNILIDDVLKDSSALGGNSVPDKASDYVSFQNNVMPYVEYEKTWVNGVLKQHIAWEYDDTTFSDLSGNDNDASPTFRTTGSDADVSASLISFTPIELAQTDEDTAYTWGTIMTDPPDEPETAYTEESRPGIFFEPLIYTIANAAEFTGSGTLHGITAEAIESFFWYNFAFFFIIGAGILTFFFLAKNNTQGLLIKCIVMLAVMIFFALPGPNIFGMYVCLYFGLWCTGILILSKSYGW